MWRLLLATTALLSVSSAVTAQTAGQQSGSRFASARSVSRDLLAIYLQTQSVSSEDDATTIVSACKKVVADRRRSKVDHDYATSLLAWALNRRGEIRNETAASLVAQGKPDAAQQIDKAAADDFAAAIRYSPDNWRMHHNYAISLAMRGAYENAIEQFTQAIDLKPDYANAYFNRGELHFELGDYEQASRDYGLAIETQPTDPQYYNSRGHSRFMLEAYEAALDDYRKATELGRDSAVYQTDLADAYQYLGRWKDAADGYRAAVKLNNQYQRAYQNVAWLMATCPEPKFRNPDLAISAAKKAMELSGTKTADQLDALAAATAAAGRFREALELQQQALELADNVQREEFGGRLALYKQNKAFRQISPTSLAENAGAEAAVPIRAASTNGTPSR